MMDRPKTIYKYEPFSSQSLQNLKAQSLYFGSPLGFNDPYDCALKAAIQVPTDKELQEFKITYSQRSDVPKEIQNEFISTSLDKLRAIVIKSAESILSQHTDTFLKTKGVTCFSERNNDLLMWSHYGGRYKGFCLEFSTEYEPFTKMRKVKYSNTMPKVNMPVNETQVGSTKWVLIHLVRFKSVKMTNNCLDLVNKFTRHDIFDL